MRQEEEVEYGEVEYEVSQRVVDAIIVNSGAPWDMESWSKLNVDLSKDWVEQTDYHIRAQVAQRTLRQVASLACVQIRKEVTDTWLAAGINK